MPLSAMQELSALDNLVNELGRHLWRKHKKRERMNADQYPTPPALRVRSFAKGSSIPVIERQEIEEEIEQDNVLFDVPRDSYDPYAEGRNLIEQAFWSIIEYSEIPENFPAPLVPSLRAVGKNLRDDESQEFLELTEDDVWVARTYTRHCRDEFWKAFDQRTSGSRLLIGHIRGLERGNSSTFDFKDARTGQRISGPCGQYWNELIDALGTSESNNLARLLIDAELDYLGRITKIVKLDGVEVLKLDARHWNERLIELAALTESDGLGTSMVLSKELERTDLLISAAHEQGLSVPAVFPSAEGGTSLVWDLPIGRVTVYVEHDEKFEVESIPDGPIMPFTSNQVSEVIDKVKEYVGA